MASFHQPDPAVTYRRPWTEPRRSGDTMTMTVKRTCNGCGQLIGDVTKGEIVSAIEGRLPADVTSECPYCSPEVEA